MNEIKGADLVIKAFRLREIAAVSAAEKLRELFPTTRERALSIVLEPITNSLLVRGTAKIQDEIEAILSRWEDEAARSKKSPAEAPSKRADASATGSLAALDLGERYLRAVAELKNARSRVARNEKGGRTQRELDESKVELERAEKAEKLLSTYIKDTLTSARAASQSARINLGKAERFLAEKLGGSPEDVELLKSRLAEAEARVKQLESCMGIVAPTPKP